MATAKPGSKSAAGLRDDYEPVHLPRGATAALCFDVLRTAGKCPVAIGSPLAPLQACEPFAGRAFTVEGRADAAIGADESLVEWTKMLSAVPCNAILVIAPGDRSRAYMGELSAHALAHRGCVAAIVDGPCRDTNQIRSMGFPVFSDGVIPSDVVASWRPTCLGGEVEIQGKRVGCNQVIVGDSDGLCIVDIRHVDLMLERLDLALNAENKVRDAILAGDDPYAAYMKYRKF